TEPLAPWRPGEARMTIRSRGYAARYGGHRISKRSPVSGEAFRGFAQHATREVVERRRDVLRAAAKVARLAGKARIDGPNRTYRSRPKLHFRGALEVEREDSCALDRDGRSEQPMVREEHGG